MLGTKNRKSFVDICHKEFGRKIIYTNAKVINAGNAVKELGKSLSKHWQNRAEIEYLDRYYRGDQPILYRVKKVRKDINNKTVENHAFEIVEHKTAEMFAEPIQYVQKRASDELGESINQLNAMMDSEDKGACDIEIGRWRSICGTAYRFIWNDKKANIYLDEAPFGMCCEDPRNTFVVYYSGSGHKAMFSCQIRKDEENQLYYFVYTDREWFEIKGGKIVRSGKNGIKMIPVIEYPNNERRLSDLEIVITMLDQLNKIQSDRMNGIEQFVQALMKFVNCKIDKDTFLEMLDLGAVNVKCTQQGVKADVENMTAELNQEQTQIAKDDVYDNILTVEGMPSREQNTGGDTGQAVYLRNGWDFAEQRAALGEPIFKKSERNFLRVVLSIMRIKDVMELKLSDIDIKITRSKTDNMSVKANVLSLLLTAGVEPGIAIKTCNLWSDPQQVTIDSRPYMDAKYSPDKIGQQNTAQNTEQLVNQTE